jgi:hypothetical protein
LQFTITIDSDDAHAGEDPRGLVLSTLRDVSKLVEFGLDSGPVRDDNGNLVGNWRLNI